MKDVLKSLFASKKFLALLAGLLAWLIGKAGLDLPADDLLPMLGVISVYLLGQGVADHGKEAAKIIAAAQPPANSNAAAKSDPPSDAAA